jgi:YceI-like domain
MARFTLFLFAMLITGSAAAQENRVLSAQEGSVLEIDGTSNKSDWTVTASELGGTFELSPAGDVVAAQFTVAAKSIKGTIGLIMNKLISGALKTSQHSDISYTMLEVTGTSVTEAGQVLSTRGTLSLAGVDQEIEMDVLVAETESGIRFTGEHPISMPDYKMRPPTAMFGALHVAKEVLVRFDVIAAADSETESGD